MDEQTRKALELARSLLWSAASNTYADRVQGIKAIDEALSTPAAPVAQASQVKALENIRDDCIPDDLTPGEYACAVLNGYYAAPAASVAQCDPEGWSPAPADTMTARPDVLIKRGAA